LTTGERTDVTDAFGNYDIQVPEVGSTFRVRQARPPGFFPMAPPTDMQIATVAPEVSSVAGVNFANQRPDIRMISATGNGGTGISVTYEIKNGTVAPFDINIFQSSDALQDIGDQFISFWSPQPVFRTVGVHTVNLILGVDIVLPGVGIEDTNVDYRLLFSADSNDLVDEPDVDPRNEDNTVAFAGVYRQTSGPVMAFGFETADHFTVTPNGLNVEFEFNNAFLTNPLQTSYAAADVTQFRLRGAGGDDDFTSGANNNTMSIPLAIWGGAGLDTIEGGDGNDSLFGGAGDDRYIFLPSENTESDTIEELVGGGQDTLDFAAIPSSVNLHLGVNTSQAVHTNRNLTLNAINTFENLTGGSGADSLTGNSLANTLTGGAGDDRLNGTTGSDLLFGGLNNDTYLFGGSAPGEADQLTENLNEGTDTLSFVSQTTGVILSLGTTAAQAAHTNRTVKLNSISTFENLIGGSGADSLTGNSLANTLTGGPGDDLLNGTTGNDLLFGGLNNDTYVFGGSAPGEADQVTENANEGTDTLSFAAQTTSVSLSLGTTAVQSAQTNRTVKLNSISTFENLTGGSAADSLTGNSLANTLTGGAGDDSLNGTTGNDLLFGGPNNDTYVFGGSAPGEADQLMENANEGIDTLSFATQTTSVILSLGTTAVQSAHTNRSVKLNSISTFENLIGGSAADSLTGNSLANTLTGGAGDDSLNGTTGNDLLFGGLNNDTYVFGGSAPGEADQLSENTNEGTDTLSFAAQTTSVIVNLGTTAVQSVHTNRTVKLNAANTFENAIGGTASDTLIGNVLSNRLTGGNGDNILVGLEAGDTLEAGTGRDILIGGVGPDTLNGGSGDDILIAGTTTSDTNLTNLNTLRTGWISGNTYTVRVANLRSGVGSPAVSLTAAINVLNDADDDDSLTGGGGTDWYFQAIDDVITDLFAGELIDVL
jgi:Ca2+-binding RTX toxin-like protein